MKKFTFKGVLDGFRSSVGQGGAGGSNQPILKSSNEQEIIENLKPDHFTVTKTFCHGFPYQPTALAYDPIQKLLAIGTKNGCLRILGRPGVDIHARHDPECGSIVHLKFIQNEGGLVTSTVDDTLHLWDFRTNKKPQIVHSLKFQRERITCLLLPLQSKWLLIGTERGNVHIVNIDTFELSGYIINWNKAIELSRKTHPGCIISLEDNPCDPNKLLIGFETGQLVLWDLKLKSAELRYQSNDPLRSICWHSDGKQFMCSHTDGSISTWNIRQNVKPISITWPHARNTKEGKPEQCKGIQKVQWKSSKSGDNFVIFSGGLTIDRASGKTPSISVIHGKTTTVLEMEHNVLDFVVLCESQWESEIQDPYGIIVLLQQDIVVIDLLTPGYPCFENPYPMDIHESPVTCCIYIADCPGDLIPAFYSVGSKAVKKTGFSDKEWPINGGQWGSSSCSYAEIIITGHADGTLKFWDTSSTALQSLYKLKTSKSFEKLKKSRSTESIEDDPFAIQHIVLCPESRYLSIAGASSHIILYKFKKHEHTSEITVLELPIIYEQVDELGLSTGAGGGGFDFMKSSELKDYFIPVRVKSGLHKKLPGYQAEVICLTPWVNGEPPGSITTLAVNSSYGLMAYGNESGLIIIDIIQKICILNMGTPDLYGISDPYQRIPKSPKKLVQDDDKKSPTAAAAATTEQIDDEPTNVPGVQQKSTDQVRRCKSQGSTTQSRISKCYSMAHGSSSLGSYDDGDHQMTCPTTLNKSNLLILSRQYYSFGSNVTSSIPGQTVQLDKLDTNFTRSRSSSISSLDNISSEAIQTLTFVNTMSKRNDNTIYPTLWIGTSLGSILLIIFELPADGDRRLNDSINIVPSNGIVFKLKGSILSMSFLDSAGLLIQCLNEPWRKDENVVKRDKQSTSGQNNLDSTDKQFAVLVSEKQSRVVALPSQICLYKQQLSDNSFVVKSNCTTVKDSVCLVCYMSNGHLTIYSLPSLKLLIDVEFVPLADLSFQQSRKTGIVDPMLSIWGQQLFVNEDANQIAKTFCLSSYGHGMYLSSPSEMQKFTISDDFYQIMDTMFGDLYLEREMPERPKEGFFTGLFGGGQRNLDREELFGESSAGKGARSIAKHIPGSSTSAQEHLQMRSNTAAGDVARAKMLMLERGEKLGSLEDKTAKMMSDAENFSSAAHQLMLKYKDKKWYQL